MGFLPPWKNFSSVKPLTGHSSVKELFTPGQEAAGARPSRAQVRKSSSETHLLKTVASGGAWHSQEDGEETLLTNPKSRPDRQKTELGRGSWHREEESEEARRPGSPLGPESRLSCLVKLPRRLRRQLGRNF